MPSKRREADGSITSESNQKTCFKRLKDSGSSSSLPEDIWCHIHSLLPLQDSARISCVSRTFLHSWRHYPNLILTKETLCLKKNACGMDDIARAFTNRVDQILKRHSGTGLKTLELHIVYGVNVDTCHLNKWLQIAIKPGIEKLTLWFPFSYKERYNFPCSLLFGRNGDSLQYLHLTHCAFDPIVGIGCLRSLTEMHLIDVHITGEELECLLSNSPALVDLELDGCSEIILLKIPCMLEKLSFLTIYKCSMLQMIESKAPNISTFNFTGDPIQLSLGQSLQLKNLYMGCFDKSNFLCYAITKLPDLVPYVETLTLCSSSEMENTPMVAAKFVHLKKLEIWFDEDASPGYDYLSLAYFLDASPVLETLILRVDQTEMKFDSIFESASHLRPILEQKHDRLQHVSIFGFCSAKSMVELTCHILANATSLESITLDSVFDQYDDDDLGRCSETCGKKASTCGYIYNENILEANKGLRAIETYILGKVPSTVKLDVRGPCSLCHVLEI